MEAPLIERFKPSRFRAPFSALEYLDVHEDRFVLVERKRPATVVLFDAIASVRMSIVVTKYAGLITVSSRHWYLVTLNDGRELRLDDGIQNVQRAGAYIERAVSMRVLQKYVSELMHGGLIGFGPLSVSEAGIQITKYLETHAANWQDVREVTLRNGVITVRSNSDRLRAWARVKVSEIPNITAFLALLVRAGVMPA